MEANSTLPALTSQILQSILQESLTQLAIIELSNNLPNFDPNLNYKPLRDRCSFEHTDQVYTLLKTGVNKFKIDLKIVKKYLKCAYDELKTLHSYEQFKSYLANCARMRFEDKQVFVELEQLQLDCLKLQNSVLDEKVKSNKEVFDCLNSVGKLKDEIEDYELEAEAKTSYVSKWQDAKTEITRKLLGKIEADLRSTLRNTQNKIEKEIRTHEEIMAALSEFIKDDNNTITFWKNKYANDLQKQNSRYEALQAKKIDLINRKKEHQLLFSKRNQEILAYKQYKARKEAERLETERRTLAAIKIQAWWRGTMVRKGFGKYRRKKDKKPKKKSSEKKPKS